VNGRLKEQLQRSFQSYVHAVGRGFGRKSSISERGMRNRSRIRLAAQGGNLKVGANHAIGITADSPDGTNKNSALETGGKGFRAVVGDAGAALTLRAGNE
jgi:hypothetical protein